MSDDDRRLGDDDDGVNTGVVTKVKPKTKKPSLYKVLLLNDDYTPMEFVIVVLEQFFNKGREDATRIMLHVHQHGVGVCGLYTYEVAETKVTSAAMYDGERVSFVTHVRVAGLLRSGRKGLKCRHFHGVWKKAYIGRWLWPMTEITNMRRSNICCWR
jgi:ATP-dependent Clp protease adaptor protein ClpS